MAKTFTAPFAQTNKTGAGAVTLAYATTGVNSLADDAALNTALLATAGIDGALVTAVRVMPRGTVTASQVSLFLRKATDAATVRRVIDSVVLSAYSSSTTTALPSTPFPNITDSSPLRLEAGDELYFGAAVAQTAGIRGVVTYVDF